MDIVQIIRNNSQLIVGFLVIVLALKIVTNFWLLLLILSIVLMIVNNNRPEYFDKDMTEFIPVGDQRYGLRGEKMPIRPIYDCRFDCYTDCYNSHL